MWVIKRAERTILRLEMICRGRESSGEEEVGEIVQGLGRCHNRALLIWGDMGR